MQQSNWAGNISFGAQRFHRPGSVDELMSIVTGAERVRALGSGHSFNAIADTTGDLVSVADLPRTVEVDREHATVTVAAGVRYAEVAARLNEEGWALHNLGSLPHISVAGACATGTHGSGNANGNLSTAVRALELVTADGDLVTITRDTDDSFPGSVVALGALGIVTQLTLDVVPTYDVRQYVYDGLDLDVLEENVVEIFASAYSVSVFTDWRAGPNSQLWVKQRTTDEWHRQTWMGSTLADVPRHPIPGMDGTPCTPQGGVPGPWSDRLAHFRVEFTPSSGDELQAEYLLPRERAVEAIQAMRSIHDVVTPVLQISEIRTVAADELWLSPSYQRETVCLHFTFIPDMVAITPAILAIEEALAPFAARPHWGKVFHSDPDIVRWLYPRFEDFRRLAKQWDPAGKFSNELLNRYLLLDQ